MAPFGDLHHESGAGWSVYWRIINQRGSGLEIWWADFYGRRVMWRGSSRSRSCTNTIRSSTRRRPSTPTRTGMCWPGTTSFDLSAESRAYRRARDRVSTVSAAKLHLGGRRVQGATSRRTVGGEVVAIVRER